MDEKKKQASGPVKWILIGISVIFLFVMLVLPLVVVVTQALSKGWECYVQAVTDEYTLKALALTIEATVAAVVCNTIFGLCAAWAMTRFHFRGKKLLTTLIDIPVTVSPVIAGLIYILVFGKQSPLYSVLDKAGIQIVFAVPGIILATIFVTFPFVSREIIPVLESIGSDEEEAAALMGAKGWTIFTKVTFPHIKWAFLYGVVLCTARAMGEFGAVSVLSGHLRGKTNTLPLHVEILYNEFQYVPAFAVSSILVILAVILLIARNVLEHKGKGEKGDEIALHAIQMDIGAKVLPHFIKDTTDRNRTSPFAFTGNKFEFRMLGSAASVANPNIVLNTAVAEVLAEFSAALKDVPEEEMESAVHALLKKTIEEHKRIIFNGNGYTDEWVEEAEKRGLYNLKTTPDALPHFIAEKNIALFTKHGIFTREELFSRYEIWLENYYKTINIESNTLAEMIQKQVIPSVYTYVEKLADTAAAKKSVVADISVASEAALISKLSTLADTMAKDLETLKADTAKALASSDDVLACSKAYQETVLEDMETLRKSADEAEALIPDELLPYPTYDELLFSI